MTGKIEALEGRMIEAMKLRFEVHMPDSSADYEQITNSLLDVRRRLDRIDEILTDLIRYRAAVRREHHVHRAAVEDAWDGEAVRNMRQTASRGDIYTSTKERYALANLEVLELRATERESSNLVAHADEAHDVIRLSQRGLSDMRQDLLALLRAHQFETTLDR